MFKSKVLMTSMLGACVFFTANANAGFLIDKSLNDLVLLTDVIGGPYNPKPNGPDKETIVGWEGANLYFDATDNGDYTFTYTALGQESGYENFFFGDDSSTFLLDENGLPKSEQVTYEHNTYAPVAFGFGSSGNNVDPVANGDNDSLEPNWFLGFNLTQFENFLNGGDAPTTAWLFYNDSGSSSDRDYDDLVIQVNAPVGTRITIPEPSSLAIFGLGLLGAGVMRRRRNVK
ncbi:PEP-CTERM sorting domain-containing protein [Vibrio alfacsensis]|uniref:PEP-CTERM sorting domain-containing protein n=1 Tax=Vibrio alfacsensis TaxID=1074311 RepID=UPI00406851D1